MEKQLITVGINELATGDREGLGCLFERDRKVYRWVKNYGSTSLAASGSCCTVFTSVEANVEKRVISPDGATASTGVHWLPGGVPVTAIGPSGSDTGDHGWVLVDGISTVRVYQLVTAYLGSEMCAATSSSPSTGVWGPALSVNYADSVSIHYVYNRGVMIMNPIATTGAATFVSAIVKVMCL